MHAKEPPSYKLTHRLFQMENYGKASGVTSLNNVKAKIVNLDGVLDARQGLLSIGEMHASRQLSIVGGQGIRRYNCNGKCTTAKCSCRKANRPRAKHCHKEQH